MQLIHCKFSTDKTPGFKVDELYTLRGQAQKRIRWKHNGMKYLYRRIKQRDVAWQEDG